MNLQKDTEQTGVQTTLFSQEGFHANPTVQQESDLVKKMTVTSGQKCLESYERFNQHGSWAKTFSALLIGMTGWYSMRCSLTWKLKDTKSKRMYFQLHPLALPTEETGYGLLPTPRVNGHGNSHQRIKDGKIDDLTTMARFNMLPTPAARDYKGARTKESLEACGRDQNNSLPDWRVIKATETQTPESPEWMQYREDLRNIPQQAGFPWNVVWPTQP